MDDYVISWVGLTRLFLAALSVLVINLHSMVCVAGVNSNVAMSCGTVVQRPESYVVEPKQVRVMFPVEDRDRHVPVYQKFPSLRRLPPGKWRLLVPKCLVIKCISFLLCKS